MAPSEGSRYMGQFRPEFSRLHADRDLYWVVAVEMPLVVTVVGKRFAGVSTVLNHLSERHGYDVYTLGGELRSFAQERGVSTTSRRSLQYLGDDVRTSSQDTAFLARRVLRRIRRDRLLAEPNVIRPIAIGGLKHVGELDAFRRLKTFKAMLVDADDQEQGDPCQARFERALTNGLLEEEFEADRIRWRQRNARPRPPWIDLAPSEQRQYFDLLDLIHVEGHRSRYPELFRGKPAEVIQSVRQDAVTLDNAHGSIVALHSAVGAALAQVRPAQQIIRH